MTPLELLDVVLDSDLPGGAKLLLVAWGRNLNPSTGVAWPGQATLARRCDLSVRHVRRTMLALEESGVLIFVGYRRSSNGGRSKGYRFNPEALPVASEPDTMSGSPPPPDPDTVSGSDGEPDTMSGSQEARTGHSRQVNRTSATAEPDMTSAEGVQEGVQEEQQGGTESADRSQHQGAEHSAGSRTAGAGRKAKRKQPPNRSGGARSAIEAVRAQWDPLRIRRLKTGFPQQMTKSLPGPIDPMWDALAAAIDAGRLDAERACRLVRWAFTANTWRARGLRGEREQEKVNKWLTPTSLFRDGGSRGKESPLTGKLADLTAWEADGEPLARWCTPKPVERNAARFENLPDVDPLALLCPKGRQRRAERRARATAATGTGGGTS